MSSNNTKREKAAININLLNHPDKFSPSSQELTIIRKVNFIFGKNGTGKTTMADEILSQLYTDYDVCVFKDFDGVIENDRLNAVALGTENARIQKEIDVVNRKIAEIEKQIIQPDGQAVENLFTKAEKSKKTYEEQKNKINNFFTASARKIKNVSNPQIAKTTYDKLSFQEDIKKANLLSEANITEYKNIIRADKKAEVSNILFLNVDLSSHLESVNAILQCSVVQTKDIPELTSQAEKQNFARQGMSIHEQKSGEICAFCGNEITTERWQLLGNYFNDKVKQLERRIADRITKIKSELKALYEIEKIEKDKFYSKFEQDIINVNLKVNTKRNEYKEFFESLQSALEEKYKNLFIKSAPFEIIIPANFNEIEKECKTLVDKHNELALNLTAEQEKAKNTLRYHEVKKILNEFKYDDESIKLVTLNAANDLAQNELQEKRTEFRNKQNERTALILQTKDEEKIAGKINSLLKKMGVVSFSLMLVEDNEENQKGQYQIKSYDESIRSITELSKGEKNIIAFLYFIFSLESIDNKSKPKIIVLDDPMTSNDDTMQYLMIGEIQKLYRGLEDGNYFILLTHNCHFYLNVRPRIGENFYDKYGVFHLYSDGKRTTIKCISKGKQDFNSSYETLWKELVFLYRANEAEPDLMLSPCRKICETYMNFTKKSIEAFYGDNINAKKLFDVNQHSIDDFEADANGKTKNEIKDILYNLFKDNDAEEHMNSYWRE